MYKPGQIITIKGKIYRIKSYEFPLGISACEHVCDFIKAVDYKKCAELCAQKHAKIPIDCYLQLINPKSQKG